MSTDKKKEISDDLVQNWEETKLVFGLAENDLQEFALKENIKGGARYRQGLRFLIKKLEFLLEKSIEYNKTLVADRKINPAYHKKIKPAEPAEQG